MNHSILALRRGAAANAVAVLVSAAAMAAATQAHALAASSYDLINGDNSSLGTSLRDDSYAGGTGNKTVPYAALAGGLGDLTDGAVAPSNWNITPGPFVGWRDAYLPSPTISFHFGQDVDLAEVRVHINKGYSPGSVDLTMGGTTRHFAVDMDVSGAANDWVSFAGLALSGDTLVLRLNDRAPEIVNGIFLSRDWILISEVTFDGKVSAVPESSTHALLLVGLLGLGAGQRRRAWRGRAAVR
ncbi:MAG: hypothetical protein IV092_06835 [Burkholderiaceae bacterium]|nr:hypothetical protein [Burkholderiaceae bacterium]